MFWFSQNDALWFVFGLRKTKETHRPTHQAKNWCTWNIVLQKEQIEFHSHKGSDKRSGGRWWHLTFSPTTMYPYGPKSRNSAILLGPLSVVSIIYIYFSYHCPHFLPPQRETYHRVTNAAPQRPFGILAVPDGGQQTGITQELAMRRRWEQPINDDLYL